MPGSAAASRREPSCSCFDYACAISRFRLHCHIQATLPLDYIAIVSYNGASTVPIILYRGRDTAVVSKRPQSIA
jgi:hypothetical protein